MRDPKDPRRCEEPCVICSESERVLERLGKFVLYFKEDVKRNHVGVIAGEKIDAQRLVADVEALLGMLPKSKPD